MIEPDILWGQTPFKVSTEVEAFKFDFEKSNDDLKKFFEYRENFGKMSFTNLPYSNSRGAQQYEIDAKYENFKILIAWCYLVALRNKVFSPLMDCTRTKIIVTTFDETDKSSLPQNLEVNRLIVVSLSDTKGQSISQGFISKGLSIAVYDLAIGSEWRVSHDFKIELLGSVNYFQDITSITGHYDTGTLKYKELKVKEAILLAMCYIDFFSRFGSKLSKIVNPESIRQSVQSRLGEESGNYLFYLKNRMIPYVNQITYGEKYTYDYGYPGNDVLFELGKSIGSQKSKIKWPIVKESWVF